MSKETEIMPGSDREILQRLVAELKTSRGPNKLLMLDCLSKEASRELPDGEIKSFCRNIENAMAAVNVTLGPGTKGSINVMLGMVKKIAAGLDQGNFPEGIPPELIKIYKMQMKALALLLELMADLAE